MLVTIFECRPVGVLVCLPSLGSWWSFANYCYLPGHPTADSLRPFAPMPGATAPFDVVQWAALPEECRRPDAVPLVCALDSTGAPSSVLPWSELTFTLGPEPAPPAGR